MADPQAQRTLVKSPPELWAELSNPETLGRRLAEFGEIRITRLIPEKTVAWEGERASGTVELESSGWGTRVRLTAKASPPPPPPALAPADRITAVIADDDPVPAEDRTRERGREVVAEAEHPEERPAEVATGPVGQVTPRLELGLAAASAVDEPPEADTAAPEAGRAKTAPPARRGFFARLLGRRRKASRYAPAPPVPQPAPRTAPASARPTTTPSVEAPTPPAEAPTTAEARTPASGALPPAAEALTPAAEALTPAAEAPLPAAELGVDQDPPASEPAAVDPPRPAGPGGARYAADMPASPPRSDPYPGVASGQSGAGVPVAAPPPISAPAPAAASRELDPEQTVALLRSVLDDLGAAHHRPFSRE